ncbi:hypothetical protein EJ070_20870 [Mesorhizobium sp. M1E.F.Ca.ET.045.02.1.1]|nr:hypothetical protein EJ070_20870 [Mesorhizobium sp. M1E.F.Ca.ET.045.02.1.1]RUW80018.1 hypothetical protein EOA29_23095 [Mesorhizobium sp. M1E.F.Ca.ET.063.01.1.1]
MVLERWRSPSSACRHLLPVKDGEKGQAPTLTPPSPRSSRGEGKGEGQRRLLRRDNCLPF